jgi:hypothetical protein
MLGIIPKFLVSRRHGIHTGHGESIIVLLIFVRKAGEIFQRKERFLPWLRFETRIRLTIRIADCLKFVIGQREVPPTGISRVKPKFICFQRKVIV